MKVLVTGGRGQLGRAVVRRGSAAGHEVLAPDVDTLDIREPGTAIADLRPDVVINAAAYTAVDKAETERDLAFAINATGAERIAEACHAEGVPLLHVSTDYVFDGSSTRPLREDDPVAPLGVYGESKLGGERAVEACGGTVVRTSWLFEEAGPSFVHTMLRLAKERPVLRVVADQHGRPTWADDLADALLELARREGRASRYHFANAGATTWHGFATAIVDEARTYTTLPCERVEAITTAEFPTPARRPAYSVLDTSRIEAAGIVPRPWQVGLAEVVRKALA